MDSNSKLDETSQFNEKLKKNQEVESGKTRGRTEEKVKEVDIHKGGNGKNEALLTAFQALTLTKQGEKG